MHCILIVQSALFITLRSQHGACYLRRIILNALQYLSIEGSSYRVAFRLFESSG